MSRLSDLAASDLALSMPLDGMQLIEASAGTGKTWTIAGLYARLIVERKLPPHQLLVMTFTRAATEELRQRLRQRLALCAGLAATCDAAPDAPEPVQANDEQAWALALLRRALVRGEETPDALAWRLRTAVTRMDEAAIFTIHGFCQRVLDTHAALLEDTVADARLEPSDRDLLEDFAADVWVRIAGVGDPEQLSALQQLAGSPEALAKLLDGLIAFEGVLEPVVETLPPAVDEDARQRALLCAWQADGHAAMADFETWFAAGHLHGGKFRKGSMERLRAVAKALDADTEPDAGNLARFASSKINDAVNKDCPAFPQFAAFAAIDEWLRQGEAIEVRHRAIQAQLLQQAVAGARTRLATRKHDLARMSYDDLITRLAAGVAGKGARQARLLAVLRTQYPVALVDEFQDTDARQFGILDRLYRDHGSLFMIGDPKQAIYGFRGGDVHAYLRAAKDADAHHHLERNFRSSAGMLRAVDAVFTAVDQPFLEEDITFGNVRWGGKIPDGVLQLDGDPVTPLTLWAPPRDAKGKLPKADDLRDALARAGAATIARLLRDATLHGEALQPASIAVLTNTNHEATLVQDVLKTQGVPAVCLRHESVYASREAMELLTLLEALLLPQSMPRARAALATGLLGRTLADLARMDADENVWREALDELARLHEHWFARGIQAMLEHLAEQHAPRLLTLPDGDRRLSNLLQLGEVLQADGHRLAGEHALRDALARHIRDADSRNEQEQLRLESDAESVQIVTLHRSKGLEYDIVLMPFAALMKVQTPSKGSLASFHRDGAAVKRLILSGSDAREPADAEACIAACIEEQAEGVRTLYVGITRARHACWMSSEGAILEHLLGKPAADGHALAAEHADVIVCQPLPTAPAQTLPAATLPALADARRLTRDLPRDWWVHSFSQLAAGARDAVAVAGGATDESSDTGEHADAQTPTDTPIPDWPRGARYGNAIHAILETADFTLWRGAAKDAPPAAPPVMTRELRAAGYAGEDESMALAATTKLVAAALGDAVVDDLCLADLPDSERRAEMEFHFGIAGASPEALLALLHQYGYQRHRQDFARLGERLRGMMTGIIDLVFRHAGRWWIVDYKTNYLGSQAADYAPASLPAAIAGHDYDLQYLIYTVALHRWLRQSLGDGYDYARDVGGVRYLFLRGMGQPQAPGNGIHADRPPAQLIEALDSMLRAPMRARA